MWENPPYSLDESWNPTRIPLSGTQLVAAVPKERMSKMPSWRIAWARDQKGNSYRGLKSICMPLIDDDWGFSEGTSSKKRDKINKAILDDNQKWWVSWKDMHIQSLEFGVLLPTPTKTGENSPLLGGAVVGALSFFELLAGVCIYFDR